MSDRAAPAAEEIVRRFCELVSTRDVEHLRPLLADDVVYHNVGLPKTVGIDAVLADLTNQWGMFGGSYEFSIVHLAVVDDTVLTERIDRLGPEGGPIAAVPVMGAFELRDDKIAAWRDYFDLMLVGKLMSGEDVTGLVP